MYEYIYVGVNATPLTIIQYTFSDGMIVPIKMAPHGNSTTTERPFFRTQPSTLDTMKSTCDMKPKDIISKTYKEAGGMLNMSSCSQVGRNLKQVYNMKQYQGTTSGLTSNPNKDLIYDLLEQNCHSAGGFVRSVNFDDGIVSVVGTDEQFHDISRFCGRHVEEKSVLGVDPTFNLGDFYVTPTVYENKLIVNKKTGKHPIFMGPALIHVDRKYGSYYYFASQLQKLCPDFKNGLNAVGTDGEEALASAFSTVFPHCIHLLCSLHKRENLLRKMRELKIEETGIKELLCDIFGSEDDGGHIEGLIDATGSSEFMEKLEMLKPKWEILSKEFPKWFTVHEVELFCSSMIASVRCLAGLGNPPKYYTTNSNESLNNLLKSKVDFKRSEWPKFNEILFAAVSEQQEEFAKAVFSQGEYEFRNEYKYLQVTHLDWIQMSREQRESKIEKARKAKLSCAQSESTPTISPLIQTNRHLSVNVEDARISHVSRQKVHSMWEKAEQLLNGCGLVLPAAGATKTSRQVASLTAFKSGTCDTPYNVTSHQRKVGTEIKCDCPVYRSTPHICQHAIAAAEDIGILAEYLHWVRKTKKCLNISQLVASQIPNDAGKKPISRRKGAPRKKKPQANDTNTISPTSTMPISTDPQIVSQVVRDTPVNSQSSSDTQSGVYPNDVYPPFPFPAQDTANSMIYPPVYDYSMPPRHIYPSGNGYDYTIPNRYTHHPSYAYSPTSSYVFPPITQPYPYCSPYPPPCNVYPTQYGNMSQLSSQSNSGTSRVTNNTCNTHMTLSLDSRVEDPPVFRLLQLTPKMKKCYGCGNNLRSDGSNAAKPPYDMVVGYKERRYFRDPVTYTLKLTKEEQNTYYHLMLKCIKLKHPSFNKDDLIIPPDLEANLPPLYKSHLLDVFGIKL